MWGRAQQFRTNANIIYFDMKLQCIKCSGVFSLSPLLVPAQKGGNWEQSWMISLAAGRPPSLRLSHWIMSVDCCQFLQISVPPTTSWRCNEIIYSRPAHKRGGYPSETLCVCVCVQYSGVLVIRAIRDSRESNTKSHFMHRHWHTWHCQSCNLRRVVVGLGPLHTRAKSRDHEIVRAQKKVSKVRPYTPPRSCGVVMDLQV
jgi:hypothetical protein